MEGELGKERKEADGREGKERGGEGREGDTRHTNPSLLPVPLHTQTHRHMQTHVDTPSHKHTQTDTDRDLCDVGQVSQCWREVSSTDCREFPTATRAPRTTDDATAIIIATYMIHHPY